MTDSDGQWTWKRGPYVKLTASQKALIGKRAAEHSVTSSLPHFQDTEPWNRFEGNHSETNEEQILGWKKEKKMQEIAWACDEVAFLKVRKTYLDNMFCVKMVVL